MTGALARDWRSLRRRARAAAWDEPLAPTGWPMRVWRGPGAPRRWIVCTKDWLVRDWRPVGTTIVVCYGLPTRAQRDFVRRHVARAAAPRFVGDLDPLDLHAFAVWRATLPGLRHAGVGSAWIALCERRIARPLPAIPMRRLEREHLALVERTWPELADVVGARAIALLRAGLKIEVEGASNPAIYGGDFPRLLRRRIGGE